MQSSATNTKDTEELIIKLLKKLQRKGRNIPTFLWQLMDQFEDESFDEKNDEKKLNHQHNRITLLHDPTRTNCCQVGHYINPYQTHLSTEPCIQCGHRNSKNNENKIIPNNKQILIFLNNYNTHQTPFGPHQNQKGASKGWVKHGRDKKWPLHYAAITGDIGKISELSKNKNIDIDQGRTDWEDKTPITCAARYGQLASVIELIKNGANPMPTPDRGIETPYRSAGYFKHKSIVTFFKEYVKYLYNFEINNNTNVECYQCYLWDFQFQKDKLNRTMSKYVYCPKCVSENIKTIKKQQQHSLIIERRILKTIKDNPSISVDTLCHMKDVKSLHTVLKEISVSGASFAYWLWLLDIDNFKSINTHLTHAIADTKIQAVGQVLKRLEPLNFKQWTNSGYHGINKVYAFRQGGDEFALVVCCNVQKKNILQKLYDTLRNNIKEIQLENMETMEHITVSIGVCHGQAIYNYEEMMKKAEEAAETVKKGGKNSIAIYTPQNQKIYNKFADFR